MECQSLRLLLIVVEKHQPLSCNSEPHHSHACLVENNLTVIYIGVLLESEHMKGRSFGGGRSSLIFMGESLHFLFKIKICVLDVVKGEKVKPVFEEPPNPTNVEVSLQQMKANDPSLQEVNLNNIKVFHYDCC